MEVSLKDIKELLVGDSKPVETGHPYKLGKDYLIRGVTMIYTGHLISVTDKELTLVDASWIADTGRFSEALKEGTLKEVEPYPKGEVIISRGSIIDACLWSHELPRVVK